jgi:hypothetical protein
VDGVVGVEWGEVERCDVQEYKVPAVGAVDRVESRVDTTGVVGQDFIGDLRVGEEGIDADVVGTYALVQQQQPERHGRRPSGAPIHIA